MSLEPADRATVLLLGKAGEAVLRVETDSPDDGMAVLPLVAEGNLPPEIGWLSHSDGDVVEPGDALVVTVEDSADPAEDLVVTWSSSVDGGLGIATGGEDGESSIVWEEGTGGTHTLSASVTDSCGQQTVAEIEVCRQEGSAFQTTPTRGDNVKLAFSFFVSGGTVADGFAVTARDTDRSSVTMAQSGGCLGYGGGGVCGEFEPLYGWNVELDTYYSAGLDPTDKDHVSFHFDGDVAGYEAYAELPEMEDGAWHEMVIEGERGHLPGVRLSRRLTPPPSRG